MIRAGSLGALATLLLAAACTSEDEPAPAPVATALVPSPTPTGTPIPIPTANAAPDRHANYQPSSDAHGNAHTDPPDSDSHPKFDAHGSPTTNADDHRDSGGLRLARRHGGTAARDRDDRLRPAAALVSLDPPVEVSFVWDGDRESAWCNRRARLLRRMRSGTPPNSWSPVLPRGGGQDHCTNMGMKLRSCENGCARLSLELSF